MAHVHQEMEQKFPLVPVDAANVQEKVEPHSAETPWAETLLECPSGQVLGHQVEGPGVEVGGWVLEPQHPVVEGRWVGRGISPRGQVASAFHFMPYKGEIIQSGCPWKITPESRGKVDIIDYCNIFMIVGYQSNFFTPENTEDVLQDCTLYQKTWSRL